MCCKCTSEKNVHFHMVASDSRGWNNTDRISYFTWMFSTKQTNNIYYHHFIALLRWLSSNQRNSIATAALVGCTIYIEGTWEALLSFLVIIVGQSNFIFQTKIILGKIEFYNTFRFCNKFVNYKFIIEICIYIFYYYLPLHWLSMFFFTLIIKIHFSQWYFFRLIIQVCFLGIPNGRTCN